MSTKTAPVPRARPIPQPSLRAHALAQARDRLNRFTKQVEQTSRNADADAVHDLRVSIRRFGQCLRIFPEFFPAGKRKRVRRRLRKVMDRAAEVRNRDIARELLAQAGVTEGAAVIRRFAADRRSAAKDLVAALQSWQSRGLGRRWGGQLEL